MGKSKIIKLVLLVLLVLIFMFSGVNVGITLFEEHQAKVYHNNVQREFTESIGDSQSPNSNELTEAPNVEPDTTFELPDISVDFNELLKINKDVVGWLYCPNTPINYPVVKGDDNQEYLRKALDGSYLKSGTLFADYRNSEVGKDKNYIIYGHNTSGDTMFGTLTKYKQQEYFDNHPLIYYITPEKKYVIELFSGNIIHRYAELYKINTAFSTITQLQQTSIFKSDIEVGENDTIITLSTCVWDFKDARFVLLGKVTEIQQ